MTLGGKRIYFAGVTECVPEVRALRNIDVAFVPMNLPLERMMPAAAAECVNAFKPKAVYLYHYDQNYAAGKTDAAAIAASVRSFRDAIRGAGIEFRDGPWYRPEKKQRLSPRHREREAPWCARPPFGCGEDSPPLSAICSRNRAGRAGLRLLIRGADGAPPAAFVRPSSSYAGRVGR